MLTCPALTFGIIACDRCIFWPSGPGQVCIDKRRIYEGRQAVDKPTDRIILTCPHCGRDAETRDISIYIRHRCGHCGGYFGVVGDGGWTTRPLLAPEGQLSLCSPGGH